MERILIIDSVGLLAEIYKYAQLAYVGGSFKHGVHNVLEPAIYGIPVLYGPIHENSYEAIKLAENNGGLIVNNSSDILMVIESIINNENKRVLLGKKAEQYASRNTGATAKLLSRWENILGE